MTLLPDYIAMKPQTGTPLAHVFTAAGNDVIEIMHGTFAYDPNLRFGCAQVP